MLSETKKKMLDLYNQGYALYRERRFEEALQYFRQAAEVDPEDHPVKIYISRCQQYIKNPPPPDWDGVYVMTTK